MSQLIISQIDEDFKLSQLPTDAETIAFCKLQESLDDYSGAYVFPFGKLLLLSSNVEQKTTA